MQSRRGAAHRLSRRKALYIWHARPRIGTVIGLAAALAASRLLASVLYGGDTMKPVTFIAVPLVLIAVSALATFAPARRAAIVDPAITLRAE